MELISPPLVNIIAVMAIVSGLLLALWWYVAVYRMHSRRAERELPQLQMPARIRESPSGPPTVLVVFYIFTAVAMISYVICVWAFGVSY